MFGRKFGELEVIGKEPVFPREGQTHRYWLVRCSCGREKEIYESSLTGGDSTTCGNCSGIKDIKVGEHAETSADRFFKGFISSQKLYEKILRMELANAIIATDVAEEVIKKEKPDILVTSHGCYS